MRRIIAITAGLAAASALVGTIVAILVGAVVVAATGGLAGTSLGVAVGRAVVYGGGLGAVLGPLAAWTLMRHVPIWRAIVETAAGTAIGAGAGLLVARMSSAGGFWLLGGALTGFAAAAIRLRLSHRTPAARSSS